LRIDPFPDNPVAGHICGTILSGVKLDLRGNSAADPFIGGGFCFVHRQLAGESSEKWTSNFM
jgi:hypothetical protein